MHACWRGVLDIAGDQYGIVTRDQIRQRGVTDRMIERAVSDGLLCRVGPAVYRVRGAPQTERMAVVAAAGHHPRVRRIAVETTERRFHPVTIHRTGPFDEPAVVVDGIACTDTPRTLIDLARDLRVDQLEDAFERARRLGLVSPESVARRFELLGGRGRKGAAKVREVLAHTRPGPLDSKLEGRAWRLIRPSSLPEPIRQLRVDVARGHWYRIDFAWPQLLVGVEAEGFEWHGSRARWKADRIRVAALERLGWRSPSALASFAPPNPSTFVRSPTSSVAQCTKVGGNAA